MVADTVLLTVQQVADRLAVQPHYGTSLARAWRTKGRTVRKAVAY
jgi:hypothetical protein